MPRNLALLLFPAFLLLASGCATAGASRASAPASAVAEESSADPLLARAAHVQQLFSATPDDLGAIFSTTFLQHVSPSQVRSIFGQYGSQLGACTSFTVVERDGHTGRFVLHFEQGHEVPMNLTIGGSEPHPIEGLWIGNPVAPAKDLDEVVARLREFPGEVSFVVMPLQGDGEPLAALDVDKTLAIGSAGKLWILAALVQEIEAGEARWDEVVPLRERSLPTGILQTWPEGSPLTLHSLASLMISRSDNTATDELLKRVGREKVEEALRWTEHASVERNQPFLSTAELFRLKLKPELGEAYLDLDASERRLFLQELAVKGVALEELVGEWTDPRHIDTLEWFASARDLAKVLRFFHEGHGLSARTARQVLAINPGLPNVKGRFAYMGYKGGSEPGVLNMSFLVQREDGQSFAVVGTWNDPSRSLDNQRLLSLMERALHLVADGGQAAE